MQLFYVFSEKISRYFYFIHFYNRRQAKILICKFQKRLSTFFIYWLTTDFFSVTITAGKVNSATPPRTASVKISGRNFTYETHIHHQRNDTLRPVHRTDGSGSIYQNPRAGPAVHPPAFFHHHGGAFAGRKAGRFQRRALCGSRTDRSSGIRGGRRLLVCAEAQLRLHHRLRGGKLCHRADDRRTGTADVRQGAGSEFCRSCRRIRHGNGLLLSDQQLRNRRPHRALAAVSLLFPAGRAGRYLPLLSGGGNGGAAETGHQSPVPGRRRIRYHKGGSP